MAGPIFPLTSPLDREPDAPCLDLKARGIDSLTKALQNLRRHQLPQRLPPPDQPRLAPSTSTSAARGRVL